HKDARVHATVLNIRPGPPRTNPPTTHTQPSTSPARVWQNPGPRKPEASYPPTPSRERSGPSPPDPTTRQHHTPPPTRPSPHPRARAPYSRTRHTRRVRRQIIDVPPRATHRGTLAHAAGHIRHPLPAHGRPGAVSDAP